MMGREQMAARAVEEGLLVRIWGARGSCPAPFPDRMAYGGNTSCVSAEWKEGLAVFDGGTGILGLGRWLEEKRGQEGQESLESLPVHIFIGHLHLDHILGLPLFTWLFRKGVQVHLYGPGGQEGQERGSFRERLTAVLGPPYWPISIDQVPARLVWHDAGDGSLWELPGGVKVRAMASRHPDGCVMYRIERGEVSVVYGMDCELAEDEAGAEASGAGTSGAGAAIAGTAKAGAAIAGAEATEAVSAEDGSGGLWEAYRRFAKGCSLLLFDAPYTRKEYPAFRGFGHSCWETGFWMARACRADRLCLCHHDQARRDMELSQMEEELLGQVPGEGAVEVAREGRCICLFPDPGEGGRPEPGGAGQTRAGRPGQTRAGRPGQNGAGREERKVSI